MKQRLMFALSLLACVAFVNAQTKLVEKVTKKGDEIVIPYEKYILPNGLTLVIHEDHSDPVAHVDVTYHVGSAREQIGKSGFAHFFEHMMFEGSDHALKGTHDKIIFGGGGTLNGSTNRDRTNYYETIPNNLLEKAIWLEADRMGFLLGQVTQQRFEIQRATVKNERGQRVDNVPYGLASETYYKNLYPYGHPYSWDVIGYLEDLNRSDVNDLKNFFLRWYGPNNATLTIGGDVKPAEVVRLVEKYFGSIPSGPEVKAAHFDLPRLTTNRYVSYTDNYARLPQLQVIYPTVPNYDKDMAALQCLSQILGGDRNSILYQNFVKKQMASSASSFSFFTELAGEFIFRITPMAGKTLVQMDSLLRESLTAFEQRGVTDDDITRFKGNREAQLINSLQSVGGKVTQLANFQTFTGNPNKIADLLKAYSSLTKEDVIRVYNSYLKDKGAVVLSIVTKSTENLIVAQNNFKIDSSNYTAPDYGYTGLKYNMPKDNFDRSKVPASGPNPTVKIPTFWKKEINGAKIIGALNTEIPSVTISISMPGGHLAASDNLGKAGLASFFTDMMLEDTKDHTAEQLAVELQKLGSSINIASGVGDITFTVQSLKKNLDRTLEILQERMFRPNFTQQSFDRLKQQNLQGFKLMKAQPAAIATSVFAKLNYGSNNILGISESGTEETIRNMTLADIQGYYENYITAQDAKVVIVGDITEQQVLPKLEFLNRLPKKKVVLQKPDASPKVDKTQVYLVDIPKSAQTEFRVGYATGIKYDPTGDFYKAYMMNFPLGGGFNSRLNQLLREQKGWTYGATSRFTSDEYSGNFMFFSGIKADVTDSALAEVMSEINDYLANGPTDEELNFMKTAVGQADALRYETGTQKAQFIRRILDYNLSPKYLDIQAKMRQDMSKSMMIASANKFINPAKLNILLVGDKTTIYEGVKKLGYPIVELDVDGKPVEKKGF